MVDVQYTVGVVFAMVRDDVGVELGGLPSDSIYNDHARDYFTSVGLINTSQHGKV